MTLMVRVVNYAIKQSTRNWGNKSIKGKVIKGVGGVFEVWANAQLHICFARKSLRFNDGEIVIGDIVEFDSSDNESVITKVYERRNKLVRPPVSNIDQIFIIASIKPQVDFLLIDKVLINCSINNISPIIVLNKADISDPSFIENIKNNYSTVAKVVTVSCVTEQGIAELINLLQGKTTCLVGQSAVGKTTLLNKLIPMAKMSTGELSFKLDRGKHTTRHSEIFSFNDDSFIVDTPGFSLYEVDVDYKQLMLYYPDLFNFSHNCKYNMCTHIGEPECAVKCAIEDKKLNIDRYNRYKQLFEELKKIDKDKF